MSFVEISSICGLYSSQICLGWVTIIYGILAFNDIPTDMSMIKNIHKEI